MFACVAKAAIERLAEGAACSVVSCVGRLASRVCRSSSFRSARSSFPSCVVVSSRVCGAFLRAVAALVARAGCDSHASEPSASALEESTDNEGEDRDGEGETEEPSGTTRDETTAVTRNAAASSQCGEVNTSPFCTRSARIACSHEIRCICDCFRPPAPRLPPPAMTAKNRTSNRLKKPGVYVDQHAHIKESQIAAKAQARAKKFKALRERQAGNGAAATATSKPAAAATASAAATGVSEEEREAEDEAAEDEEASMDDESAAASAGAPASSSASSAAAAAAAPSDFTVSLAPFVSSSSSAIASTTESSLSDDKVLGVALYEWLLTKQDADCHTLWERFQIEWDLITETERPPGTNRPINLHSYLTYLRATNNKATVRKDVKIVRETLARERAAYLASNPSDPRARLYVEALNGNLLSYYLKIKNLIPFESEAQRKRREAKANAEKRKVETAATNAEGDEGKQTEAAAGEADAIVEAPEHKRKKGKFAHPAAAAATRAPAATSAAASSSSSAAPLRRPISTVQMGQANAFAALLDCD